MSKALIIAGKEFRTYFSGPVAYMAAGLFTLLISFMFYAVFMAFAQRSLMMMYQGGRGGASLNDSVFGPHFGNINIVLLIMIPALTMRLFSEEKKSRTIDLLMTSPLSAAEIVIGKYLGGLFVVWAILSVLLVYPVAAGFFGQFDKGPVVTGFLGIALISAVYVSIGVFASSLTESGIIAYILAFVIELFFWVISWGAVGTDTPEVKTVFTYLSIVGHFGNFTRGIIDTSGVIYYLSLIFFFCFLTHRTIESARWR